MRLVKTTEEIARIQSAYARRHFMGARTLTVLFETTPEVVQQLLPPPLEPAPEPLGAAWVTEVANSNCVGPFLAAAVYLRARYKDITGDYCISMPVSTPEALTWGRELYGEPKKLAKVIFEQQGEHVWGSAERHAVRFLSVRGRLTEEAPPGRHQTSSFYFKFTPRADGNGLDSPPQLVHVIGDARIDTMRRGRGELVFRDSPDDPVSDIPA